MVGCYLRKRYFDRNKNMYNLIYDWDYIKI